MKDNTENNIIIYGIKNCDSVRKAQKLLQEHKLSFSLMDFRDHPPSKELFLIWWTHFGESLINKRSRHFQENKDRILQAMQDAQVTQGTQKNAFNNEDDIISLLQDNPIIIKRPIVFMQGNWLQGLPALKQFLLTKDN